MEGVCGRVLGMGEGRGGSEPLGRAAWIVGMEGWLGMDGSGGIEPGIGMVGSDGIAGRPGIAGVVCSS